MLLKLIALEEMDGWEEDILSEWIGGRGGDVEISPFVRERRDWLRERGYPHFPEVGLVGGRRASKGYCTGILVARRVYATWLLGDPGRHYGIDPDKEIYFSNVAVALDQAKKHQFADIVSAVTHCKPMRSSLGAVLEESLAVHTESDERYVRELQEAGLTVARDFSKLRIRPHAANADSLRGGAIMVLVLDEMAKMQPGESKATADQLLTAAKPSLDQFKKDAQVFYTSSPATRTGRFHQEIELAMAVEGRLPAYPYKLALRFPSWELYRNYRQDPRRRFRHAIQVSPDWPDEGLNADEIVIRDKERLEEKANPETYAVEKRAQWAIVLDAYLREHVVDRAFRHVLEEHGDRLVQMAEGGTYVLAPYTAHADPSSTTAGFGFALGHAEVLPDPHRPGQHTSHVFIDVVKRWDPHEFPGETIDYYAVLDDLVRYINLFRPQSLTFDQHHGATLVQMVNRALIDKGLSETRVYEDKGEQWKNWQKWEVLKTAMNLDRVHIAPDCPDSEWAKGELKHLQKKDTGAIPKVDRQTSGEVTTKDVADGIRDVCYDLIGDLMVTEFSALLGSMSPSFGAKGGYPIGGRHPGGPMAGLGGPGTPGGLGQGQAPGHDFGAHYDNRGGAGLNPARGRLRR